MPDREPPRPKAPRAQPEDPHPVRRGWRVLVVAVLLAGLLGGALAVYRVIRAPAPQRPAAAAQAGADVPQSGTLPAPGAVQAASADLPAPASVAGLAALPVLAAPEQAGAIAEAPADGPLRIVAEPWQLPVLANAKVRLKVAAAEGQAADLVASFTKFVWHFEDGSPPVSGVEVEHEFSESSRDRHVTVEAFRGGQPPLTLSKRLPVERLEVVHLDGQGQELREGLPPRQGTRLLFVAGASSDATQRAVAATVAKAAVDAVVMAEPPAVVAVLDPLIQAQSPGCVTFVWSWQPPAPATAPGPVLQLRRDPSGAVAVETISDHPTGLLVLGELALAAIDTRGDTVGEPALKGLRKTLESSSAYPAALLLSPRPLTLLRDGELIADRAYRIYQHALQYRIAAVVSVSSAVFYDGRFGGVTVAAVGRTEAPVAGRLAGQDSVQPASVTLVELGPKRRLTVLHLTGPAFDQLAPAAALPPEAGQVRR